MIAVHITLGITVALLLVLTVFLFMGKGTILINGMMFMPKEARDKVNKKALGRFVSLILLATIVCIVLMWIDVAWLETSSLWPTWVATGLLIIVVIIAMAVGISKREKWFGLKNVKE